MNIGIESYAALAQSPACPSNWPDDNHTFEVCTQLRLDCYGFRRGGMTIAYCDTEQDAIAFIGNLEREYTPAIYIYKVSRKDASDSECIFCAEFDEDVCRYLSE